MKTQIKHLPERIFNFYRDGFRQMTIGRKLWVIIAVKLVILFAVFKLFFFPDILNQRYDNDMQRADAVRESLLGRGESNDKKP